MKRRSISYYRSRKNIGAIFICALCFLSAFCLLTGSAFAHRVTTFAWVEEDTVYTESKFSGGRKVNKGRITVYDRKGNRLLEGLTNSKGEFSFKVPGNKTMKIVLEAGTGHRAEWTLSEDEIKGIEVSATESHAEKGSDKISRLTPGAGISQEDVQQAVEKALDKKLRPIMKMLAESRTTFSLRDILGGIGYILGLVGIAAYIHARKRKSEPDNQ